MRSPSCMRENKPCRTKGRCLGKSQARMIPGVETANGAFLEITYANCHSLPCRQDAFFTAMFCCLGGKGIDRNDRTVTRRNCILVDGLLKSPSLLRCRLYTIIRYTHIEPDCRIQQINPLFSELIRETRVISFEITGIAIFCFFSSDSFRHLPPTSRGFGRKFGYDITGIG